MHRKSFRIEQFVGGGEVPAPAAAPGPAVDVTQQIEMLNEIKALRALVERPLENNEAQRLKDELEIIYGAVERSQQELAVLAGYGSDGARVARAAQELDAVKEGTEEAAQRILKAAEAIEDMAKTFAAAAKNDHERGMAQDLQEQATAIFEACNFQDLIGQRVTKAVAAVRFVEAQVVQLLDIWASIDQGVELSSGEQRRAGKLLNGPKLAHDTGHATQDDIDSMFAAKDSSAA